MNTNKEIYGLGELADGILDGYLTLCSPADAIGFAIGEFLERPEDNPFTFNDKVVTANEMLEAVSELLTYFEDANAWRVYDNNGETVKMNRVGELIARYPRSRFARRRKK